MATAPRQKKSFRERVWSRRAVNNFDSDSDSDNDNDTISKTSKPQTPYIPQYAAAGFLRTTGTPDALRYNLARNADASRNDSSNNGRQDPGVVTESSEYAAFVAAAEARQRTVLARDRGVQTVNALRESARCSSKSRSSGQTSTANR